MLLEECRSQAKEGTLLWVIQELNFPEISCSNWKGKTRKSSFLPEKAFLSQQEIKYILNSIFL